MGMIIQKEVGFGNQENSFTYSIIAGSRTGGPHAQLSSVLSAMTQPHQSALLFHRLILKFIRSIDSRSRVKVK